MKTKIFIFFMFILCGPVLTGNLFGEIRLIKPETRVEAPAFTLKGFDESVKSLEDWKGKVILLNFFATWCVPCRDEMPAMEKMWNRFKNKDFVIIAISADIGNADKVKKFCEKLGVTFPVLLDPEGDVRNQYEIMVLPTSYIIGKDGKISGKIIGIMPNDDTDIEEIIENLL